jgi:putative transposase
MPIEERTTVDLREEMALRALDERLTVTEVAVMFGVSRPTVRLWRERYRESGRAGLEDRSHRPHSSPAQTKKEIEDLIVAERLRWGFGSKKILRRLADQHAELELPRRSTVDGILSRNGLVEAKKPRRRLERTPFMARYDATAPGELMTADHKGQFRLKNGVYCYPLTLKDRVSHFVSACTALRSTSFDEAWPCIVRVFREYGCPLAFQSDNGPPFGNPVGRFSRLSVELMVLDIQPVFGRPGMPQDNGSHERMHRELKAFATRPPEATFVAQQERFDAFLHMYNIERPHEAIGQQRPANLFKGGPKPYPRRKPQPEYAGHMEKRTVSEGGNVKWKGDDIFLSETLAGKRVAFEETGDGLWTVRFHRFLIGKFDEREKRFL